MVPGATKKGRGRKPGAWTRRFDAWVLECARHAGIAALPPTRELAARFGVANSSVFRRLLATEKQGVLWRAPNGRFFPAAARSEVENPLPMACLFRRIEDWSMLYQELMEGISSACREFGRASLLWHDDALVRHTAPGDPPQFASVPIQKRSLKRFLARCRDARAGVLLDHAWQGACLQVLPENVRANSIVLCRPAAEGFRHMGPDTPRIAHLAISHLAEADYRRIYPVRPFSGDGAVDALLHECRPAAEALGVRIEPELRAEGFSGRARLLRRLRNLQGTRTALLVPEDNVAGLLFTEAKALGVDVPGELGILSLQGTRLAQPHDITHVRTDFAAIGKAAAICLLDPDAPPSLPEPELCPGASTAGTPDPSG